VRHLIDLGHTRIGHLGSWLDAETFRRRIDAMAALLGDDVPYETAPFDYQEACTAALRLLDASLTAIFCDDDVLAGGVYLAARERGLRIPEDLSVVGFDDLPFARVFDPPLTTVAIDPEALGAGAFDVLLDLIEGRPAESRVLPVELVVRDSTAPPR